ncbi:Phosphatidylinositol transfer protein sfh5 [Aspergillus cristatus]|uniref:Phosphatidylinositol transfer protein SFH5 n=1 Tax=Aspergillus cristatus TaxID=573508 RepID=A0A1E3BGS6_ASPCR|nr:Phosphatidylinositol transfer protein sfh5 [Aspergillus cristatus]
MSDQPAAAPTAEPVSAPAPAAAPAAEKAPESQPEQKPEEPGASTEQKTEQSSNDTPATENKDTTTTETPAAEESKPAETPANDNKENDGKEAQPEKPAYLKNNAALSQFFDSLPEILKNAEYSEMWGVTLQEDSAHVPTINILIKYLRANEGNVKLAEKQLVKALKWRKTMDPVALAESGVYDAGKFAGLGYLTNYTGADGKETVVTWNIYGAVKDLGHAFGDLDEFIKWRVALMELAVKDLKLGEATTVIDYDGEDPYQMIQVHDYLNVSFLRMNPKVKAATKKTIDVFTTGYPELLREKFFVNVPAIMGWMFTAMKVFLSKNTTRKFHPIANGASLAREFPGLVDQFPATYGGKGSELQGTARTVNLTSEAPKEAPKEEPKDAPKEAEEAPKEQPKEESKEPAKTETTETPATTAA